MWYAIRLKKTVNMYENCLKVFYYIFILAAKVCPHSNCSSISLVMTGLPHTQGIQGDKGNFQVEENLMETKEDSGKLREFW